MVKQQRVSPSNQQKRSHEVAFSGENRPESTASVLSASHDAANGSSSSNSSPDDEHASKKLRPDEENDDSNSINDASDVISDEEENNSNRLRDYENLNLIIYFVIFIVFRVS